MKRRKRFVKKRVGDKGLRILADAGIDVDKAMDYVIGRQLKKEAELKMQTAYPTVNNTMTSELV